MTFKSKKTARAVTPTASNGLSDFIAMLSVRRPAGSKSERKWITEWIAPLGAIADGFGNLWLSVGVQPSILFSSHTDTVHRQGGAQKVTIKDGIASVGEKGSNCLGADCTTGAWLMRELALAGVPGVYVWHREEEWGGIGSEWARKNTPKRFAGIRAAIAFDRRGKSDVITHQGSGRCCSDAFAASLAMQLGMAYAPSDAGIFTDTANYTGLIGECTNVSVGYCNEHTSSEVQDLAHLLALRKALMRVDWKALVYSRAPGDPDPDYAAYAPFDRYSRYDRYVDSRYDADGYDAWLPPGRDTVCDLVREYPDEIADILEGYGYDAKTLRDDIADRGGYVPGRKGYRCS